MNIGIRTDKNDFFYDIHSLVKSFFPDDDVAIFSEDDEEKCACPRDLTIRVAIPPAYERRKDAKDLLKRELYETLSAYTEQRLPWGMLSGIRPTKIPMQMLREGQSEEACVRYLMEADFVSEEKARLAAEIAGRERALLAPFSLDKDSYSLYVHIPFCPSICLYCTFSSSPASVWKKQADAYLKALETEMRRERDAMHAEGNRRGPTTVYIGGGTPTTLTASQMERLLSSIEEIWDLRETVEYTVEAGRPDSFSEDVLGVMKRHGVTRISVNPQTMNDDTLTRIGRRHTSSDVRRAFSMAREAGFDNINMDIILGLPGEGESELARTLEEIEKLSPEALTVHSLAVKRASRLRLNILEDRELDVSADRGAYRGYSLGASNALMDEASRSARGMGMVPYYLYRQKNMRGNLENTGFALPGRACLYNILIMEEVQSIKAFGAGASTKRVYEDGRIERTISPKDVTLYMERVMETCDGKNRRL